MTSTAISASIPPARSGAARRTASRSTCSIRASITRRQSTSTAIARGQLYGLSARGLAIDTGQPQGEEFPFFRTFWIEEPLGTTPTIRVYALLESPSTTGAYRFTISPGDV